MLNFQEERANRSTGRRAEASVGEETLLERAVGEPRPLSSPAEPSLLRPQQHRNAVWRWHVRRRPGRP